MSFFKLRMFKLVHLLISSDLVEIVEVELADEGREVGVLEVFGENGVGESEDILDDERVASR